MASLAIVLTASLAACGGGGGGDSAPSITVDAGADIAAAEGAVVSLQGDATSSDGQRLTTRWSQVSGPPVVFENADSVVANVTLPQVPLRTEADIVLRLTATAADGTTASDDLRIRAESRDFIVFFGGDGSTSRLYKYDSRDDRVTAITDPLPGDALGIDLKISPDGTYVAYRTVRIPSDRVTVGVARTDGTAPPSVVQTVDASVGTDFLDLEWTPDSSRLVFTLDARETGVRELYLAEANGTGRIIASQSFDFNSPVSVGEARLSSDGRYIAQAIVVNDSNVELQRFDMFDRQGAAAVSETLVDFGQPRIALPPRFDWSPASPEFAYAVRDLDRDVTELFVATADGSAIVPVTQTPSADRLVEFDWSPDGQRLAYTTALSLDGPNEVRIASPGAGTDVLVAISDAESDVFADLEWSPGGERLAFARRGSPTENGLYTVDPDGSDLRAVNGTLNTGSVELFSWSPDGAQLLYLADEDPTINGAEYYVVSEDGGGRQTVVFDDAPTAPLFSPVGWSGDSAALVYTVNGGPTSFTVVIDELGSAPDTQITRRNPTGTAIHIDPAFSADNAGVAYASRQDGDGSVFQLFVYVRDSGELINVSDLADSPPAVQPGWQWWPGSPQQ